MKVLACQQHNESCYDMNSKQEHLKKQKEDNNLERVK